ASLSHCHGHANTRASCTDSRVEKSNGLTQDKEGTEMARWVRKASLITVVFQNTALALCMRYSRLPREGSNELYLVSTAVLSGEAMKILVSLVLASFSYSPREIWHLFFSRDALTMLIPAALYSFQNGLQYVAASNLDVSVCQVLYQMKLVTTALFSVTMLGRQLSRNQWLGILACAAGVAVVQLATVETQHNASENQQVWVGFLAVTTACVTSGLAAVYTEKIFKTGNTSLWVRNMHLAAWSLLAVGGAMYLKDGSKISQKGFFFRWDLIVCIVVLLQALGGMAVAVVAKYADNISKGFATAVSIILTCIASVFMFDLLPSAHFILGTALVLLSLYLYTRKGPGAVQHGYLEVRTKDVEPGGPDGEDTPNGNSSALKQGRSLLGCGHYGPGRTIDGGAKVAL
ncbi:UDP-N-acetylglucosamine transporter (Golgi UDP-GlcNAc transporter) (Solute carrier family 35 member A3), partial [Durusdinium trenchii]